MGSFNGAILNHSDKKICYSISSEKLILEKKDEKTTYIFNGIEYTRELTTAFEKNESKSKVVMKPNCFSTVGLMELESKQYKISLWVGSEEEIEELLFEDIEIRCESDVRLVVSSSFEVVIMNKDEYRLIKKGEVPRERGHEKAEKHCSADSFC